MAIRQRWALLIVFLLTSGCGAAEGGGGVVGGYDDGEPSQAQDAPAPVATGGGGVPVYPGGGGGGGGGGEATVVVAPITLPEFTLSTGGDFNESRAEIERLIVEGCGDGTLCLNYTAEVVPTEDGIACVIVSLPSRGPHERGSTIVFGIQAPCEPETPTSEAASEPDTEPETETTTVQAE